MAEDNSKAVGFAFAAVSIFFFGSFALPLKSKKVQATGVDPVVFQIYYSISVFITSWLAIAFIPHGEWHFSWWAVLGAALWVPASVLSIFAIQFIGLSIAQGLWSGVTIIVAFIWGATYLQEEVKVWGLTVLALICILVGILGISRCELKYFLFKVHTHGYQPITEEAPLVNAVGSPEQPSGAKSGKNFTAGFACAVGLGLLNGSLLIPASKANAEFQQLSPLGQGLAYVPSFGVGALPVTIIVAILYFGLFKRQKPNFYLKETAIPGLIAGVMWNVGNVASILATVELGMAIGYPLSQLALVVAGMWGMFLFKELVGLRPRTQFFVGVAVLLAGAVLLSMFGPQPSTSGPTPTPTPTPNSTDPTSTPTPSPSFSPTPTPTPSTNISFW